VLPNLSACIATPTLPGCSVVLPNLSACIATPTLPGCSVVLPTLSQCATNKTAAGCEVVLPPTQTNADQPIAQAISSTINIINTPPTVKPPAASVVLAGDNKPSPSELKPADAKPADAKPDEKKDQKKETVVAKDTGAKKDEPVKKLYCN
jgi:hypothetical protein